MTADIGPDHLKFFAGFIERETGIVYSEGNFFQLENRLKQIAKQMGKPIESLFVSSFNQITGDFRKLLLDLATNNETSFYRDKALFISLAKNILPEIIKKKTPGAPLRIWSAACSTGQEPYTIAMVLLDYKEKNLLPDFKIEATDICEPILDRAKAGVYTQLEVARGLPTSNLLKYFTQDGENWHVNIKLKSHITFSKLNLLQDWNVSGPYDLIFCRNVLIYQSIDNKKKIIERFQRYLASHGYLIMGATESIFGLSTSFKSVLLDKATFYQRAS